MPENTPYSDKELLEAVRTQGEDGWVLFTEKYHSMIWSIVSWPKWNFSGEEKSDVYQNIHLQLQKALPTFRQESSLAWFVKTIAIRQCVNEIRRQVRWRNSMTSSMTESGDGQWCEMEFSNPDELDPHAHVLKAERRDAVKGSLKKMHETCRRSILMYYMEELSYKEMATRLGISINTVGSRLAKCLNKLYKELMNHPLFRRITDENP